jgi:hypothetical protein
VRALENVSISKLIEAIKEIFAERETRTAHFIAIIKKNGAKKHTDLPLKSMPSGYLDR